MPNEEDVRLRGGKYVLSATRKRGGGSSFAVGPTLAKRKGSVFYGIDLPSGKVRVLDRDVLIGALEKSDVVIRSSNDIKPHVKSK